MRRSVKYTIIKKHVGYPWLAASELEGIANKLYAKYGDGYTNQAQIVYPGDPKKYQGMFDVPAMRKELARVAALTLSARQ